VDRDQTFRYAGVSSDHIGHAIDDAVAHSEGYPSKILQGLCTFAMCSGALVDIAAGSDPRRLRRLAGRFSAPTFPGRELAFAVYDVGRTREGYVALAFEASQDGVTVVKHGRAEVTPD
jgi:acyl dehydratase